MRLSTALSGALVALLSQIVNVSAHGAVTSYTIDGVEYTNYNPFNNIQTGIGRPWPDYNPILSATASNIACNNPGTFASPQLTAPVKAGGTVVAHWAQWTHREGPVTVWLNRCPDSGCDSYAGSSGWFKIAQTGLISGTVGAGQWGNGELIDNGNQYTATIPASLKPGYYLIRHELLAIHQANTPQFYPECAQLQVSGSGSSLPSTTVSLPGAYSASDPYIDINIYSAENQVSTTYVVPGGSVWSG